jgi:hypothetical protein
MGSGHRRSRLAVAVALSGLTLALAACGGSSSSHTTSTTSTAATKPAPAALHVVLTGTNHTPVANKPWHYVVRVTDSAGRPVSAVVHGQVLYQGNVVGQIDQGAVHSAPKGVWTEAITWPAASVGQPLVFQVVVTALGTTTKANYPIQVAAA